jgi:large subunit ribosomal protein L19e
MELVAQKRLAARVMNCGVSRVHIDPARLGDVAQAITTSDIRKLVSDGVIYRAPEKGVSKGRARKTAEQKRKGRRKGKGSRKGNLGTRFDRKHAWINRVRAQRKLAKEMLAAGRIDKPAYKGIYRKIKGGFFRSRAHLMGYVEELKK